MIPDFLLDAIAGVAAEYAEKLGLEDAVLVWNDESVIVYGADTFETGPLEEPADG